MGIYVTNNPLVRGRTSENILFIETQSENGLMDVLVTTRDLIHKGHVLLSHPLSGSVKPGETPYKTVALSETSGGLDMDSLRIIEESMQTACKLSVRNRSASGQILNDLQLVDYTLIFGKLT